MTFPNQTGTGWQCPNCKQWVTSTWHNCPQLNNYPSQYYTYQPYIDPAVLERIAKALEAIATQLTQRAPDSPSAVGSGQESEDTASG